MEGELLEIIGSIESLQIDKESIKQGELDLAAKTRRSLFPWRGQFSPELIELLIDKYAQAGGTILDPFCGSGTVLFEAARKKFSCYATEIIPAGQLKSLTNFSNSLYSFVIIILQKYIIY
jgi:DNA modification methylase